MSERDLTVNRKHCLLCGGLIAAVLLILCATGFRSSLRKESERSFMLRFCRFAVSTHAASFAPEYRKGYEELLKQDPEFLLRLNSPDIR